MCIKLLAVSIICFVYSSFQGFGFYGCTLGLHSFLELGFSNFCSDVNS